MRQGLSDLGRFRTVNRRVWMACRSLINPAARMTACTNWLWKMIMGSYWMVLLLCSTLSVNWLLLCVPTIREMKSLQSNFTRCDSGISDNIPSDVVELVAYRFPCRLWEQTSRTIGLLRFLKLTSVHIRLQKKSLILTSGFKTPRLARTLNLMNVVPVGNRLILVMLVSVHVAWCGDL